MSVEHRDIDSDSITSFYLSLGLLINADQYQTMKFDFGVLLPKYLMSEMFIFVYKILIQSVLRFPIIVYSNVEFHSKAKLEDRYKQIVDEEFEQILSYLVVNGDQKALILNQMIQQYKKINK